MNTALIIIDQQKGIDSPKLGLRNNPRAEVVMLNLLSIWRSSGWPIFHIKHCSRDPNSVFWPKQAGFEFKEAFLPKAGEGIIEKSVPCAFTNTDLAKKLKAQNINETIIVGAATNNSVESTARTAGNLYFNMSDFKVMVIEDACFAFAKPDYFDKARTAQEVHAMSLANLQGEYAQVMHSSELILPA